MSKQSISRIALRAMSIRLTIVVLSVAALGFWFNYRYIEERTILELSNYVQERASRESIYFQIARKNVDRFAKVFLARFEQDRRDYQRLFNQKFQLLENGTWAPKDKNTEIQMFLKKDVKLTEKTRKTIVIIEELLNQFGPAWSSNFTNIWVAGIEDYGLAYWPSRPKALTGLPTDHSFLVHEYMTIGLPENNPTGKIRWTGPYLDIMTDDWMISINRPIYVDGEYVLSVGMDILLNDFYGRSINNILPGTYNIVMQKDGRLVVHPKHLETIKDTQGKLFADQHGGSILQDIWKAVSRSERTVIDERENDLFLGVGKIAGPEWWFVIVYPKSILNKEARKIALFLALVGLLSLLVELLMLFQVLRKHVTMPIKKLIVAANRIARGASAHVEVNSEDEVGQLGEAFNVMAQKVHERDQKLSEQAAMLEMQVQERSKELDIQRANSFQAAKMATLGEISAGIAHEINNPLGTISLNAGGIRKRIAKGQVDKEVLFPYLRKIEDTTERISKIVRGMRVFSRKAEMDEIGSVPVYEVVENTLNLCQETLKNNEVTLTCQEMPHTRVLCREVEVIQTLLNLIQNAIDALSTQKDKQITIGFEERGDYLCIFVEDNGPGVPKEIEDKIMNPFFTTKELGKGTGLGLFISLGLMKSNGGNLSLEQVPGHTRFIVSLRKA